MVGLPTAKLLVVLATDGEARTGKSGGLRFGGNADVFKLLPETTPFEQLNVGRNLLRQRGRPDFQRYDCILNLVSDPDQHPHVLEGLRKLLRGYRGRVINRPDAVLRTTRDQVAKRLAGIDGLRVPLTIRLPNPRPGAAMAAVARSGLCFPLIVRLAGTHTGKSVSLAADAGELEAACGQAGDYILTEFVDFRSADGLFRKYRLWSFGRRTIFRHLAIADRWNIHIKLGNQFMFDRPDLIKEEVELMRRPEGDFDEKVHAVFDTVRQRLGLDFFGMDFAFDPQGRMVLFEANATMSYFPLVVHPRFSFRQRLHAPAAAAFTATLFPQA